jgi:hypothetical protein
MPPKKRQKTTSAPAVAVAAGAPAAGLVAATAAMATATASGRPAAVGPAAPAQVITLSSSSDEEGPQYQPNWPVGFDAFLDKCESADTCDLGFYFFSDPG